MRILVTGGAGFIGSHLAERSWNAVNEVWVLDDLSTGSLDNLKSFESHPAIPFRPRTVTDTSQVLELAANCERIFHLAAAVGVRWCSRIRFAR
jgi:UDP-glucose 4-epimerase